jgi:hypothetical protein
MLVAKRIARVLLAVALAGCGSGKGGPGPDGATPPGACAGLGECACVAASDRCVTQTQQCWCPKACDPSIYCICDGGLFYGCDDREAARACGDQLAAVQTKCENTPGGPYVGSVCSTTKSMGCVAACLAKLATSGSCAEIGCAFCPPSVCDCGQTGRSPFENCVLACGILGQ